LDLGLELAIIERFGDFLKLGCGSRGGGYIDSGGGRDTKDVGCLDAEQLDQIFIDNPLAIIHSDLLFQLVA
jgi:hypothetical protein